MAKTQRSSEFRFEIGTVLAVERLVETQRVKGTSRIVGAHDPRILLAEMPLFYGRPMFTTVGEKCVVRLLHEGKVVGFRAPVVKIVLTPFPLMMLQYPEEIEEMSLRQHERLDCTIPMRMTLGPSVGPVAEQDPPVTITLNGQIVDLGESGCQVGLLMLDPGQMTRAGMEARKLIPEAERPFYAPAQLNANCAQGRAATMAFDLPAPASKSFARAACEIRWNRSEGEFFLMGVRFSDSETQLAAAIHTIVEHQRRYFSRMFSSAT